MPRTNVRAWAVAGLSLALLATGLLLIDWGNPPDLLLFIGRFHPTIVHFPIGLLLLAALLEGLALLRPFRRRRSAIALALILGAVSAVAAVVAGLLHSLEGGYDEALVSSHKWLGIAVAVGAVSAAVLKTRGLDRAYAGTLLATVGTLLVVAHLGGSLTHGPGYLTYYLPPALKRAVGVAEARAAKPRIADIDSALVYQDLIAPIFKARCTSCHSATKEKGGLRLDTPKELVKGGKSGPVVVAGSPEESELLRRVTLPPGHKDAMPADGAKPLDIGETELIRWWIAHGASFEKKVADIEEVPASVATLFHRIAPPRIEKKKGLYAFDVAPADAQALAALHEAGYGIEPVAHDVSLLQVTTLNIQQTFGDEELTRLLPVAEQITWLDLSGTRVGDLGLAALAKMPHLTRLSLAKTAIGDEGLRHLSGLQNLEYANLYGTSVSDAGLKHLEGLDRLRALYLWQTQVTNEGAAHLKQTHPNLEIVLGAPGSTANAQRKSHGKKAQSQQTGTRE
jgi:uncharacterized membrane protein/mono/diheme cytochrome c family protein